MLLLLDYKMVSKIVIIALIVGTASAATWIGMPPRKPEALGELTLHFIVSEAFLIIC